MRRQILLPTLVAMMVLTACGAGAGGVPADPALVEETYVVLVSFDGMRYDMLDRVETPHFDALARAGARATGLIPAYPSKTFPNHYTLATGLYPAHHGLVDNSFYDPALNATYRLGDDAVVRDGRWYGGEPIWVTAETQGVVSASFFWVGSEAEIDGVRPTYFKQYDGSVPYAARVDTVLHWLSLPPQARPRLVLLYFSEPDHSGHEAGPDAAAVDSVVREMDGLLGRLVGGLGALPHGDRVNVVAVSDHGMAPVPTSRVVYLDDYADLEGVRVVSNSTQALLYVDGDEQRLWSVYEALEDRLEHATVYLPEETPNRWHYTGNRRIGDLLVVAEAGWLLRTRDDRPWGGGGMHGWDPWYRPMHGIFVAAGPGIRPARRLAAFESIHVYPLVAHLLGLTPAAGIDGRLDVVRPMLTRPSPSPAPGAAPARR